jgi:predicted GH43/DUF377 family glycosyl hydrolase
LCAARSKDGINDWQIDAQPTFAPDPNAFAQELWGIEDSRITYLAELEQYAVVYTAYSHAGPTVGLALTKDFHKFDRYGVITQPIDKDAALLPRRINGRWALIHRPEGLLGTHMWVSYSNDLQHWGTPRLMLRARRGGWWDANKIGLATPPIETPQGWLVIYHGVKKTAAGSIYRLGLALFELETPEHCLQRGDEWIFGPEQGYERRGDVDNVVFPCGYTLTDGGDTVNLYYGAADTSIAVATGSVKSMLRWLDEHSSQTAEDPDAVLSLAGGPS